VVVALKGIDVPITRPVASSACSSNLVEPDGTGIAVSNPDFARLATGFNAPPAAPARTRQDASFVAPFQLA
jgi:hypothetical protein